MKILSIYPYTHISSAALMIDGQLKAAISEERLNRIKMSTAFPIKSINWCLEKCKIKLSNIDLIDIPWNPSHNINTASSRWINDLRWRGEMLTNIPIHLMKILDVKPSKTMSIEFNNKKMKKIYENLTKKSC